MIIASMFHCLEVHAAMNKQRALAVHRIRWIPPVVDTDRIDTRSPAMPAFRPSACSSQPDVSGLTDDRCARDEMMRNLFRARRTPF